MRTLTPYSFKENLKNLTENFIGTQFLLAVSGGADSMVLLDLFKNSGIKFQVAHINYHFRGEDSDLDQKLVEDYCKTFKIPFHLRDVTKVEKAAMTSLQTWARDLRYRFFNEILKNEGLNYMVTAHNLNDQLETFIINLSRGSGIKGLSGIPANENNIIRPLLNFSKEEIYRFARQEGIKFREDKSNKKNDYLRNKIRNEIVPKFLETNANFLGNFSKSLSYLNQVKKFSEEEILKKFNQYCSHEASRTVINRQQLLEENDFVRFEIMRLLGFKNEKEIQKIFKAKTGSVFQLPNFRLVINRNEMIFEVESECEPRDDEEIILMINPKNEIIFPKKNTNEISEHGSFNWYLDGEKVNLPLKLRKKRDGDLFFPLGMIGKKKVSKFFKDEKLSVLAKPKIWLLCDASDNILGVLPYRQDRRFAADKNSQKVLKATNSKN